MSNLELYRNKFARLKRNRQNGGAPHKPVLLLALIDLYDRGLVLNRHLAFSDVLIATFHSIWKDVVGNSPFFKPTVIYPMYHLRSEGFWKLYAQPGFEFTGDYKKDLRSFPQFKESLAYVALDEALHVLLLAPVSRAVLQNVLLETYFSAKREAYLQDAWENRQQRLQEWTLQDGEELSWEVPKKGKARLTFEEEKWIRHQYFPKNVNMVYEKTCCVSGLHLEMVGMHNMVDACHIHQWADSQDDHIQNGIALSPTLHRAFDHFLFTITEDFRVRVGKRFRESSDSPYRLRQFEGVRIRIPNNPAHRPGTKQLKWHNDHFLSLEG
ncbi:MAG TPA: hypothetical protein ENJ82_07325 [Bacteroidetes bacterium]|nr:hypothetical protein [Bacteroidota bacterium]